MTTGETTDYMPTEKAAALNPAVAQLLRFFEFHHLPPELQAVSIKFNELANWLATNSDFDDTLELVVGLRKLLEAKDCCVRARLHNTPLAL
jgi:hypothetical protein